MEIEYKKLITIPGFEPFEKWDMEPNPFRQFRCKALRGDEPNWFVSSLILANTPIGSIENQIWEALQDLQSIWKIHIPAVYVKDSSAIVV